MALDRYFTGFENAAAGEFLFAGSPGLITTYRDWATGASFNRSGTYSLLLNHAGGIDNHTSLPGGAVMGTTGTVSAGSHKRFRCRAYFKLTAWNFPFGNQFISLLGISPFVTYQQVLANIASIANCGAGSVWLNADGRFGIYIPPATTSSGDGLRALSVNPLIQNQWYQLILDIDLAVAANTTVTVTARIVNEGGSAYDETITANRQIGATDVLGLATMGSVGIGAFQPDYTIYWDDLVYHAASNTDAANQLVLPTATRVVPILATGIQTGNIAVNAGADQTVSLPVGATLAGVVTPSYQNSWSADTNVAKVNEVPINTGGDQFFESTNPSGSYVRFQHASAASLGITAIVGWKVYANGRVASGTGSIDALLADVVASGTWGTGYGDVSGAQNPAMLIDWTGYTLTQFALAFFGVRKQNGVQDTFLGNILSEALVP